MSTQTTADIDSYSAAPLPAGLNAEEQQVASDALAAYLGYWRVADSARQDPQAKNWQPYISQYATAEVVAKRLETLAQLIQLKAHQVGTNQIYATVTVVTADAVTISSCLNGVDVDYIDDTGASVADEAQGAAPLIQTATMVRDVGGLFKLSDYQNTEGTC